MKKINVLAVAPYAQLSSLFWQTARKFPNISLNLIVGNLEQSIEHYVQYSSRQHDVLISRGGTAALLKNRLSLPVIEMKVSSSDMLRAIKLASQTGYRFAVVGFANITDTCHTLSEILQLDLEIHEYQQAGELPALMEGLKARGIHLVVGDVATVEAAEAAGMQNILITSSAASIERAFREVEDFFDNLSNVVSREQVFRAALDCADCGILILNQEEKVLFSNDAFARLDLTDALDHFRALMKKLPPDCTQLQRQRHIGGSTFNIRMARLTSPENACVFYIHKQLKAMAGCSSIELEDLDAARANVIFPSSEYIKPVLPAIRQACETALPVLINGQAGTEKNAVARYIHCNGAQKAGPFAVIQSNTLTQKEWNAMVDDENSILYAASGSIFFEHIHLLPLPLQGLLTETLRDLLLQNRVRILASSTVDLAAMVGEGRFLRELYHLLNGICISMPSLNQRQEDIPALAAIYINQYNAEFSREVIGLEPDAIAALQAFRWVLNIDQLRTVIRQLVLGANSYYITRSEVEAVLRDEKSTAGEPPRLDLNQPLEKIERDVILEVLKQENMNQSNAARRLEISRSTLWRKLGQAETR